MTTPLRAHRAAKAAPPEPHYEVVPRVVLVRDDGREADPAGPAPWTTPEGRARWHKETRGWSVRDTTTDSDLSGVVKFSTTWQAHEFTTKLNGTP